MSVATKWFVSHTRSHVSDIVSVPQDNVLCHDGRRARSGNIPRQSVCALQKRFDEPAEKEAQQTSVGPLTSPTQEVTDGRLSQLLKSMSENILEDTDIVITRAKLIPNF